MKAWTADIECHIQSWSERLGSLNWWPKYVYHFTDVNNAVRIIRSGSLYSRSECLRLNLMAVDNANVEVIQQTQREHLDFVRLYFRPRTPTQFRNEGIRPIGQRDGSGAHCPVPVFFCFDTLGILSMDESEFSNGNMASIDVEHHSDREFFLSIPFQYVFHNSWFSSDMRHTIVFHRNAEVLVPHRLPLKPHLKFIACRSAAERQTLLHFLPPRFRRSWSPLIRIGESGFFERKWTFIEEVVVVDDKVVFRFNPSTITPGPFTVRMTYQESGSTQVLQWEGANLLRSARQVRIPNAIRGEVRLYLDDTLAFADTLIFEDLPF